MYKSITISSQLLALADRLGKISYYLYGYGHGCISKGIEVKDVADFSIWTNQRKFSAKYDKVENR